LPETHAQRAIFLALRRWEAWHLSRGGPAIWAPSAGGPTFATSVVRVPERLGRQLRDAVLPAGDDRRPHYVYPVSDLHVTIANLDRYHDIPPERMEEALTDCLRRMGPITLSIRGLGISRATVFAQAHVTPSSALLHLRTALRQSLAPGDPRGPRNLVGAVGFCNLVRFQHEDISAARALVHLNSRTGFGSFPVSEIEIARTNKVFSAANTVVLAKCAERS
jgi:hypothetical protein